MANAIIKYTIGFVASFVIRLIPIRPPNVEPIMATLMPYSKKYGYFGGFLFAFLSIVLFDFFTQKLGIWTLVTAIAYSAVAIGAAWFFAKKKSSILNYASFSIVGTLFYDAVTMMIGPLFFGQPLIEAVVGQVPFTALHLGGNLVLGVLISPLLYKWVVQNESLEPDFLVKKIKAL